MSRLFTEDDPRRTVGDPMQSGYLRVIPLAAVILGFALVSYYYAALPADIPLHFGLSGEADGYGPKALLWVLPVLNLGLFYLLGKTSSADYRLFNYPVPITEENAATQHRLSLHLVAVLRLLVCLLLAYLIYTIILSVVSGSGAINQWVIGGAILAFFVPIIYYYRLAKKSA